MIEFLLLQLIIGSLVIIKIYDKTPLHPPKTIGHLVLTIMFFTAWLLSVCVYLLLYVVEHIFYNTPKNKYLRKFSEFWNKEIR